MFNVITENKIAAVTFQPKDESAIFKKISENTQQNGFEITLGEGTFFAPDVGEQCELFVNIFKNALKNRL